MSFLLAGTDCMPEMFMLHTYTLSLWMQTDASECHMDESHGKIPILYILVGVSTLNQIHLGGVPHEEFSLPTQSTWVDQSCGMDTFL